MEYFDKIILALIAIFGIIGTFLIKNANDNKVKENPLVGAIKAASQLRPNLNISSVHNHENNIYPNNKKMKWRNKLGYGFLIISFLLTLYSIFF